MGNVAVDEKLAGSDELDTLTASETEPEDDDEDDQGDEDEGDEFEPDDIPHG